MRDVRWMRGALPSLVLCTSMALGACDNGQPSGEAPAASASAAAAAAAASASAAVAAAAASASAAQAAQAAKEDETVDDNLRDFHRHHHHGGVISFISMAIDTMNLDQAKKAQVEKIQTDLHTKMGPARDANRDLIGLIADGVAAGKIDAAKVDAAIAKLATASATIHTASNDALVQLHDALLPVERQTLVDKVYAHWQVWHKVNAEEKLGSKDKGTHLAKLTEMLKLTPDEVNKISTALAADVPTTPQTDPKPVQDYVEAFGKAFTADKFDPKAIAAPANAAAGHVARHGGARMAKFYEAITPVLTPDQRTQLATHLRERLNDHHAEASGAQASAK